MPQVTEEAAKRAEEIKNEANEYFKSEFRRHGE